MPALHDLPHKKADRRQLRTNLTPAEARLWTELRNSQLAGLKFRCQHSIGEFIVDFYCPEARLVVELDGAGHFTAAGNAYDAERTSFLNALDIRVLRFENKLIWSDLAGVLHSIAAACGV